MKAGLWVTIACIASGCSGYRAASDHSSQLLAMSIPTPSPTPIGPFKEAIPVAMPQAVSDGGPVMTNAQILPVSFSDDPNASTNSNFVAAFVKNELPAMVMQYGVQQVTALNGVTLSQSSSATMSDAQIEQLLSQLLNSNGAPLGAPSSSTVYAIFFPASTVVTVGGEQSCQLIGGYHSDFADPVSGMTIHYAVIDECTNFPTSYTASASHEIVETLTDPEGSTGQNSYNDVNNAGRPWAIYAMGEELGDLCAQFRSSFFVPSDVGQQIQAVWSNEAAAAGNNPCEPEASLYFNAAPIVTDNVNYQDKYVQATSPGVEIPVGKSKTVEIDLFSNAPTNGNWTVSAVNTTAERFGLADNLTLKFDKTSGQNGTVVHLTITVNSAVGGGGQGELVRIQSQLGNQTFDWPLVVGN